jgi:DNA-binding LacI/PurR family transcriptional regulator
MARARVTIVDIARELGLSKTTVSDALQGRGQVAAATRERVRAAAAELGYVSNRAAQSLRTNTVGAVGLYVPPIVRDFSFYMEFAFGAVHGAAAHDQDLVLFARDPELSARRPLQVDGAIVVDPLPDDPFVRRLVEQQVTVVTAGRCLGAGAVPVDAVIEAPHAELARTALDALWAAGRRRPAFLGSDQRFFSSWAHDVREAYLGWCARRGVAPHLREIAVDAGPDALRATVEASLAPADVDALVCGPQGFAGRVRALLGAARADALELVSLVGDPVTELADPAISCVDVGPGPFGEEAAALLNELLAGGRSGATVERVHAGRFRPSQRLRAAVSAGA